MHKWVSNMWGFPGMVCLTWSVIMYSLIRHLWELQLAGMSVDSICSCLTLQCLCKTITVKSQHLKNLFCHKRTEKGGSFSLVKLIENTNVRTVSGCAKDGNFIWRNDVLSRTNRARPEHEKNTGSNQQSSLTISPETAMPGPSQRPPAARPC